MKRSMTPILVTLFSFCTLSSPAFADEAMDVKALRVGQSTLEALGEIENTDDSGYSAIREVKCVDMATVVGGTFPVSALEREVPKALILSPGSKIVIRRSVLNEYSRRFGMKELVRITCD
jgi:hypothetical protein